MPESTVTVSIEIENLEEFQEKISRLISLLEESKKLIGEIEGYKFCPKVLET